MASTAPVSAPAETPQVSTLKTRTVLAYASPTIGVGYMYLLVGLYVMKYSTDVLLIAPAAMSMIFFVSRIWDGISDPMVGYLSDRTQHRWGRRKIWIALGTIPIMATFIMIFSPPADLGGTALVMWMAVAIIGFYSAMTAFVVPHMSLGAELTTNYHDRSRLFGARHAVWTIGSILSLLTMQVLIGAENDPEQDVREVSASLSIFAAIGTAALILFALTKLKERKEFQGRAAATPFRALRDVWRNKHARLLIVVTLIENIGSGAIGLLTLYVAQYVIGAPILGPLLILCYMIPSSLSVPMWLPLSRKFGKIRLWMASMIMTGVSFGGFFALPFIDAEMGRIGLSFFLAFFAGLAAGCGGTIGPSVQSDIIDYDEYTTGERKEGTYFAAWNFVYKSAAGIIAFLTGLMLQFSGFIPNEEQTMTVKVSIVALYGLFPLVCYTVGAWLFSKFTLDEAAHAEILTELEKRRAAAA